MEITLKFAVTLQFNRTSSWDGMDAEALALAVRTGQKSVSDRMTEAFGSDGLWVEGEKPRVVGWSMAGKDT